MRMTAAYVSITEYQVIHYEINAKSNLRSAIRAAGQREMTPCHDERGAQRENFPRLPFVDYRAMPAPLGATSRQLLPYKAGI